MLENEKDFLSQIKEEKQVTKISDQFELNKQQFETELQKTLEQEQHKLNKKFRAILNIQVTKNNIIAGLYDSLDQHRLVSGGKDTGGNYTDRGTDKNSAKVMQQVLDVYEQYLKELKVDHLTIYLIKGNATKRSISGQKSLTKLLTLWKLDNIERDMELITNKSRKPHGKPNRRKGGRRGRRV